MRGIDNTMPHDGYVTPFLLAAGVEYESIPGQHRVLPSVPAFVELIKERITNYEATPYLDMLFALQVEAATIAHNNMDIVVQYYIATHSKPGYAGFKQWLKEALGLDVSIFDCDVDHIDRSLKQIFGSPSDNNASQLMCQHVLGGLQLLHRDDHMMKDL